MNIDEACSLCRYSLAPILHWNWRAKPSQLLLDKASRPPGYLKEISLKPYNSSSLIVTTEEKLPGNQVHHFGRHRKLIEEQVSQVKFS